MKAKTRQQIAQEFGICTKTLNKWLKQANLRIPKGLIQPRYQKLIYDKLSTPKDSQNFQ